MIKEFIVFNLIGILASISVWHGYFGFKEFGKMSVEVWIRAILFTIFLWPLSILAVIAAASFGIDRDYIERELERNKDK
jgi:hypothetical protein